MAKKKEEVKLFEEYENIYIIEKGIDIPSISKGNTTLKYPFPKMDIGDSFVAPKPESHRIRSAANAYSKRSGRSFTLRTLGDVIRIWRIS